jgi:hypothetical protein
MQIFLFKRSDPDPGTVIQNPVPYPTVRLGRTLIRIHRIRKTEADCGFTTHVYFRNSKKSFLAFIKINFKIVATFAKHVFNM